MKIVGSAYDKKRTKKVVTPQQIKRRKIGWGIFGVFFLWFLWWGFQSPKGTIQFGVCRTFLELNVRYPQTIYYNSIEVFDKSLRMYYTYIDPFGSHRSEMMECDYRPFNMLNLEDVKRDRVSVDHRLVVSFNRTVPAIVHYRPDLALPIDWGDDLIAMKRDYKYNYEN